MNKARRKELEKAVDLMQEAYSIIESVKDEEEDAYYNLPDGIKESELGEEMDDNVYRLEEIMGEMEEGWEQLLEM